MASYYEGRLALIAGGSEGIGRAIAAKLVAEKCGVIIGSRTDKTRDEALAWLKTQRASSDVLVEGLTLDVTDTASVHGFVETATSCYGRPDFLINCAGF